MKKYLAFFCVTAIAIVAVSVPAMAQSDRISDGERPLVDGGYHACTGTEFLAELGIRFHHPAYDGKPVVFQILPTKKATSASRKLLDHLRANVMSGPFAMVTGGIGGVIVNGVSKGFDIESEEFSKYETELVKCLTDHPVWRQYWYSRIVFGANSVRPLYIRSWMSILLQLACHAYGAVGGELVEDGYNVLNVVYGGLLGKFLDIFRDSDDDIDINVGNPTWDLEGHRRAEYNPVVWLKETCNW